MLQQSHYPVYQPDSSDIRQSRVSLMLTYEQILAAASAIHVVHEQSRKLFSGVHLTDKEVALNLSVEHACINCALSIEARERNKHNED
jgi:hypothetical protein